MNPMQPSTALVINDLPPAWKRSPKKFRGVHKSLIQLQLIEWRDAGKMPALAKFISEYLADLPENLPPEVILDITKWAVSEWQAWYAEKPEPA